MISDIDTSIKLYLFILYKSLSYENSFSAKHVDRTDIGRNHAHHFSILTEANISFHIWLRVSKFFNGRHVFMSIQSSETTVRVFLVETDRLVPYTEFSATALIQGIIKLQ
jgi:hypothetical protein